MAWIEFLDNVANTHADKMALIEQESGRELTYAALVKEVSAWSHQLKDWGVVKGDRVAYLNTNTLEHVTLLLACARLGALFVPLNFRLAVQELSEIVDRVEPKVYIQGDDCKEITSKGDFKRYKLNSIDLASFRERPLIETTPSLMTDPLLMLFTSGTTGSPKGVLFHGQMLEANQRATCENWGLLEEDKTLVETPFFHTGGYNVLCLPLMLIGGTSILAEKFELNNVYDSIAKYDLSVYFAVPTMFQMISEDSRFKAGSFKSMRFLISGGAYCPKELMEEYQKLGLMFKQGFGLTEVGPNCFLLDEADAIRKVGSIGKPMPHSEVSLVDEEGNKVAQGEVGELLIGGPHVCGGYFKEDSRFKEATFAGQFKTGDLAKCDEEGFYYIVGRKKDMYISGGENVYPAEVEKKIRSHERVHECVVVPVPSEKWGEVGYCFIRGEGAWTVEELKEFLNPILSRYKQPHYVEVMGEFPMLASGKIDRKKLQAKATASI